MHEDRMTRRILVTGQSSKRRAMYCVALSVLLVLQLCQQGVLGFMPVIHKGRSSLTTAHHFHNKQLISKHTYDLLELRSNSHQLKWIQQLPASPRKPIISTPSFSLRNMSLVLIGVFVGLRYKFMQALPFKSVSDTEMESGWSRRGFSGSWARTVEVWTFALSFLYKFSKVKKLQKKDPVLYSQELRKLAALLTQKILVLGPTFIKLGQLLSTRVDVLPKEVIKELVLLQDKVPGFSGDVAVDIIQKELNVTDIKQVFPEFDKVPIAAASLGQVHLAKGVDGRTYAVKVQRQGLKQLFDMDLKNIRVLALLLDKFDPKSDGTTRDWLSIYDESAKLLYREIDYQLEANNAIRFKQNFKDVSWIKVPDVYLDKTTKKVITMEYVPGIKVNDIAAIEKAGIDRELLAKRSAESYLAQLCRYGFFHCDPHPGNVACDAVEGGRLIYYDFGMMDELQPAVKQGLVNLLFGIYENDTKEVCNALEQMGVLKKGVDRISIEKVVRYFVGEFTRGIQPGEKWTSQLSKEQQQEIKRQRRLKLGADLFSFGKDIPFKFPATFTFVLRAFTSLDGIGKGLDPKYDLTRLAKPYLTELIALRDGSAGLSLLKTWTKKLSIRPVDWYNSWTQSRKVATMEDILTRMEQGELKLRVRVLESERAFERMQLVQQNILYALLASVFFNMGAVLHGNSLLHPLAQASWRIKSLLALAAFFAIQLPLGMWKVKKLDKKFASFA